MHDSDCRREVYLLFVTRRDGRILMEEDGSVQNASNNSESLGDKRMKVDLLWLRAGELSLKISRCSKAENSPRQSSSPALASPLPPNPQLKSFTERERRRDRALCLHESSRGRRKRSSRAGSDTLMAVAAGNVFTQRAVSNVWGKDNRWIEIWSDG